MFQQTFESGEDFGWKIYAVRQTICCEKESYLTKYLAKYFSSIFYVINHLTHLDVITEH